MNRILFYLGISGLYVINWFECLFSDSYVNILSNNYSLTEYVLLTSDGELITTNNMSLTEVISRCGVDGCEYLGEL